MPIGFTETQVVAGLSNPTAMEFAPDGRLFVAQQGGALRVIKNGQLLTTIPRKVTITLNTKPNGLVLKLDGVPVTASYSVVSVVGMIRTMEAVTPQTKGGRTYRFVSWSDGGPAVHNITTPAVNKICTATHRK